MSGIKINIDNILDQLCLNFVEQPVYLPWKSRTSQRRHSREFSAFVMQLFAYQPRFFTS